MSNIFRVHRGQLPPNDAAFIRSTRANQNIWWAHRRWYWLACVMTWVLNKTQMTEGDPSA